MSSVQDISPILKKYIFDPITSEKQWNDLVQLKKQLWCGDIESVMQCNFLHPEIAASWVRSYQFGVNPYEPLNPKKCYEARLQPEKEQHPDLDKVVQFSQPVIEAFLQCTNENSCIISLDDPSGYPLLLKGNKDLWKSTLETLISTDEQYMGTNTHALIRKCKCPVLLQGPQNYFADENRIISGAPILDLEGNLIAILVLAQSIPPRPWDSAFQAICTHILSLLNAMAFAIQNQVLLHKSIQRQRDILHKFSTVNRILNTTLNIGNDGIATIDSNYHFLNINKKARQWFAINKENIEELDVRCFLANPHKLEKLIEMRRNADLEDTILPSNQACYIEVFPIDDSSSAIINGTVLRINSVEKLNTAAAKRAGTQAVYTFDDLIGNSPVFQSAIQAAKAFAYSTENILLIGESGTGKEMFAQAIHNESNSTGPFVAINCAAMPRDLIASELFGYEGGSFTGADRKGRPGKFELAQNGTIFLDEIGDMPIELQPVLLRVLQNKEVTRLGGKRTIAINCRVIAATNKNILNMVQKGAFRSDLYYRLSTLKITIPPLRKRKEDIKLLIDFFLENYSRRTHTPRKQISPEALEVMQQYDWPGNVRQLENTIIYSINICSNDIIGIDSLPSDIFITETHVEERGVTNDSVFQSNKRQIMISEQKIIKALAITKNNVSQAAVILGISRSTLYRRLRSMGLIKDSKRVGFHMIKGLKNE